MSEKDTLIQLLQDSLDCLRDAAREDELAGLAIDLEQALDIVQSRLCDLANAKLDRQGSRGTLTCLPNNQR